MVETFQNLHRRNLQQRKQAEPFYNVVSLSPMSESQQDHSLVLEKGLATPDICPLDICAAQ